MRLRRLDIHLKARIVAVALVTGCTQAAVGAAEAQAVGDPVPFVVNVGVGNTVLVAPAGCDGHIAAAAGGVTLFGANAPGGVLLGRLAMPVEIDGENQPQCPVFIVPGAPPGTYWLTVVLGQPAAPSVTASAWQSITIGGGACTTKPHPPLLLSNQPVITGNNVSVGFGSPIVCPGGTLVLEVGTTPGGKELGETPPFTTFGITAPVPSGTYYVRARIQNATGKSEPSVEVPLHVPNGCAELPQGPIAPTVTVNGNVATLSWSQSPGLPNPTTFYVLTVREPASGLILTNVVIPPALSFTTPPLGSGQYRVGIAGGNRCGTTEPIAGDLFFTIS